MVRDQLHTRFGESPAHSRLVIEPSDAPFQATEKSWDLYLGQKTPFTSFDRSIADKAWEGISMKISREFRSTVVAIKS